MRSPYVPAIDLDDFVLVHRQRVRYGRIDCGVGIGPALARRTLTTSRPEAAGVPASRAGPSVAMFAGPTGPVGRRGYAPGVLRAFLSGCIGESLTGCKVRFNVTDDSLSWIAATRILCLTFDDESDAIA